MHADHQHPARNGAARGRTTLSDHASLRESEEPVARIGVPLSAPPPGDRTLLDAALHGDVRAARELVHRHGGRLHACAFRILGDVGAAEEVVQDAFARLFRSGGSLRHDATIATWLHAVAVNRCRDTLRRSSFAHAMNVQPLVADMPDQTPDAHATVEQHERDARLGEALSTLPAELREVIALRFASDLSYTDIAEVLGCATGTVASRLHRALARLGSALRAAGFSPEGA